jgi:hypothetical protein
MKRLFVLAALMMAFATAPAFASGCAEYSVPEETEKPATSSDA